MWNDSQQKETKADEEEEKKTDKLRKPKWKKRVLHEFQFCYVETVFHFLCGSMVPMLQKVFFIILIPTKSVSLQWETERLNATSAK